MFTNDSPIRFSPIKEEPFFHFNPGQTQHYLPMLMNSARVRHVMQGMNGEQQNFVNELLGMLGRE
jgi:hypothetical protein